MNTTENNKLIAEFMGFELNNSTGVEVYYNSKSLEVLELDKLKFHSDWNWLMEVVDKCSKTACDLGNTAELELKLEMWMFLTQELTSVYCACVEFIKWYNQQNQ